MCMFPFKYGDEEYTECTSVDHGQPWCSHTADYDEDGLWGNCILGKCGDEEYTECTSVDHGSPGACTPLTGETAF